MKYAKIISSGMYVPKKVMTNAEFEKLTMFTIDPYFSDVIGINHRHISEEWETPTYMAAEAAKKALARIGMKPEEIEIWAAGGGRLDHTMANLFLLHIGAEKKISTRMIDEYCEAFIAGKETTFQGAIGQTVSLLAISPKGKRITLSGFKYTLHEENLSRNIPRGISNMITKSPASIYVGSGSLLVIRYWQKDIFPEIA